MTASSLASPNTSIHRCVLHLWRPPCLPVLPSHLVLGLRHALQKAAFFTMSPGPAPFHMAVFTPPVKVAYAHHARRVHLRAHRESLLQRRLHLPSWLCTKSAISPKPRCDGVSSGRPRCSCGGHRMVVPSLLRAALDSYVCFVCVLCVCALCVLCVCVCFVCVCALCVCFVCVCVLRWYGAWSWLTWWCQQSAESYQGDSSLYYLGTDGTSSAVPMETGPVQCIDWCKYHPSHAGGTATVSPAP